MENIKWFGHASFSFVDKNRNKIYYVDPFELKGEKHESADLIFITHAHSDHLEPNDIQKILKEDTVLIAPPDCLAKIDVKNSKIKVEPNGQYEARGFKFWTFPA